MALIYAIPDTSHNANPTNRNRNSKCNPNPNRNTRYRCEYGTLNSMFATLLTLPTVILGTLVNMAP